jgi:hypothetical protein
MVISVLCDECMLIFIIFSVVITILNERVVIFLGYSQMIVYCSYNYNNGSIFIPHISHSILGYKHMSLTTTH